jgi:two-component system chemotaxis sensor kinase CheA
VTEDEEILLAFLEESRENLDQLDRDLVDLETQSGDPDLLSRVFRAIHTLKGTCGFLGFPRLEALAHAGEDLLGALRVGTVAFDPAIASTLLRLVDAVRTVLNVIEATSVEPADDNAELVSQMRAHLPVDTADSRDSASAIVPEPPGRSGPGAVDVTPLPSSAENTVRVDVTVLDTMLDLVGELVLARTRIGELAALDEAGALAASHRDLRVVTADLQDSVMTARLQPIGTVMGKFHRIARDLAAALGKQVVVQLEGEDVGVDKAVNEALRDPLLHLVRNAVDHGIETPLERVAAGKPAAGLLRIRASHEGGRVHIEVDDDGRGVNVAALVAKAVAAGAVSAEDARSLTAAQALDLMFQPGLTTRDEVTSTSGRGVGMDVVRAAIEQVGGSTEVTSLPGQGTSFRLNVPLTLAIMPVLVIRCAGGRYAIPQAHLLEVTRLDDAQVAARVDVVEGARLLRLRGRLLPLVDLAASLGVPARRTCGLVVVLVETDGRRFGLVVDEVADTVDAVVKPLPRLLRSLPVFAGTTILGDGRPALVVDIAGLAAAAAITSISDADLAPDTAPGPPVDGAGFLLATAQDGGRLALRVAQVRRLEIFSPERVERTGDAEVVQYGGEILPLIRVAHLLPERRQVDRPRATEAATEATDEALSTVVCETSVGPVGFVVTSIDDVVAEPQVQRQPASRAGVEACVVVEDRLAELLDIEALSAQAGIGGRR